MLTMRDLLEDPKYREYLCQIPKTPPVARDPRITPQWRVFLQRAEDSRWVKAEFRKYSDAFKFFKRKMNQMNDDAHFIYRDAAINNKRLQFAPPTRLVKIKGKFVVGSDGVKRPVIKEKPWVHYHLELGTGVIHDWCPYCRRPTEWRWFFKHPAMKVLDPSTKRCSICGVSERLNTKDWYH